MERKIGFTPSYMEEEVETIEKNEYVEEVQEQVNDNEEYTRSLERLLESANPNEIALLQKIEAYSSIIRMPDFGLKSDLEKNALISDMLLFNSLHTEIKMLKLMLNKEEL